MANHFLACALFGLCWVVLVTLADPCSPFQTCTTCCQGGSACGWCPSSSICFSGDSNGPSNASCNVSSDGYAWVFNTHQCSLPAAQTCATCTSIDYGPAGWCPSRQQCLSGDGNGPWYLPCPMDALGYAWMFNANDCSLRDATSCTACMNIDLAGLTWCPGVARCWRSGLDSSVCAVNSEGYPLLTSSSQCGMPNATSCSQCFGLGVESAGWCPSQGRCWPGDSYGPLYASCPQDADGYAWMPSGSYCLLPNTTTCNMCFANGPSSGIGWCPATGRCLPGSDSAPYDAPCPISQDGYGWMSESSECVMLFARSCGSCVSVSASFTVGWCESEQSCWRGTNVGPSYGQNCSLTPVQGYGWTTNMDGCNAQETKTCSGCTMDGYGWCPVTQSCVPGSGSGPYDFPCQASYLHGQWTTDTRLCVASSLLNCSACTNTGGLGWCSSAQVCLAGTSSGPTDLACDDWVFSPSNC